MSTPTNHGSTLTSLSDHCSALKQSGVRSNTDAVLFATLAKTSITKRGYWSIELGVHTQFHVKNLFNEPETGMSVTLLRYPAGLINPHHRHPCGHGMYVLEGKLVTHRGEFGPGTFVWFPEGEEMEHGASADGDMTALFITNKSFRIDYITDQSPGQ